MAKTIKGIYYPSDYASVADVPKDMKEMAESIEKVIENEAYDDKQIQEDISELKQKNTEQDTTIQNNTESIEELQKENTELKAENERLNNDINAISVTEQAEGENITLNDTAEARFKKFGIGGNSWQKTGDVTDEEGSVIGTMPSPEFESDIRNCGDNVNLINKAEPLSYQSSGSEITTTVLVKNTNYVGYLFECEPNTDYTISREDTNSERFRAFCFDENPIENSTEKATNGFWGDGVAGGVKTKYTFKTTENSKYIYVIAGYNGTISQNVKAERGTKATQYSPYNYGNANVTICNKNIANPKEVWENMKSHDAGNCSEVVEDSRECIKFAISRFRPDGVSQPFNLINFKYRENTSYTIRMLAKANGLPTSGAGTLYLRIIYKDGTVSQKGINASDATSFVEFRLLSNSDKTIERVGFAFGTGHQWFIDKSSIFIAEGDTTNYAEHQEQSFTFPLAEGQRLMKGDYLADDGIHHKRRQTTLSKFTKLNTTTIQGVQCQYAAYYIQDMKPQGNLATSNFLCDRVSFNAEKFVKYAGYLIANSFVVLTDLEDTVENVNSLLEGSILEYDLAEEEIEPYTPEQQAVYNEIKKTAHSYGEQTHIFSTDEISPIFNVEARKDMNTVINNIESMILANASEEV